jgi:glutamate synthase (NADPH) large chain
VMGCIMMRVCHLDTCPVGVATQNPDLRARFSGQAEHVVNFFKFVAEEMREIMAQLGFRSVDEMVGRSDLLDMRRAIDHYKARGLDFSRILYRPEVGPEVAVRRVTDQDHGLQSALDQELLRHPQIRAILDLPYQVDWCPAVQDWRGERPIGSPSETRIPPAEIEMPIRNVHRTVGTILGSEITRKFGGEGLPENTIRLHFEGSAGQSFGAFAPKGLTLTLAGDANDYCGKGLSGGRVVVYPSRSATFVPEDNIVIGNVALYGATSGNAFFRGKAGERFCVRNSGAHAVVEGTGDHCCEYMTGGIVVAIGKTGRNFGAGMSGGAAFVLDEEGDFHVRLNTEMVDLEPFEDPEDQNLVRDLLQQHVAYTGSTVAGRILENWETLKPKFRKVMPVDYRRVLEEQKQQRVSAEAPGVTAGVD